MFLLFLLIDVAGSTFEVVPSSFITKVSWSGLAATSDVVVTSGPASVPGVPNLVLPTGILYSAP